MKVERIALILAALVATGCGGGIALTERGTAVQQITRADMPDGCRLVADVAIGIPPDAGRPRTEEQLVTLMRNKAGELGGSHVLVEFREQRGQGAEAHYVGSGTAYRCDPSAAPPPPAEPAEETSGDETPLEE